MTKTRYESFGGIVSLDCFPMLVFLSREKMRRLGYRGSPLWERQSFRLSAPTEIHFALTNRCDRDCAHCYMDSGPNSSPDLTFSEVAAFIDSVAAMGVFHLALGGGESMLRDDLFAIARYARSRGIVPNLTTNGSRLDSDRARACRIFGQVNVSIDGFSADPRQPRDHSGLQIALAAVEKLKAARVRTGINCVVNRHNFFELEELFRYAREFRLRDIEFLRLKPAGRGKAVYRDLCCTPEQHREFFPRLLDLVRRYRREAKIDCSYVPMACYHHPDKRLMEKFLVRGCDGGNLLAAVDAAGGVKACSFASGSAGSLRNFPRLWESSPHFQDFFHWPDRAPAPCRDCNYLDICRGGCRVVAEFLCGSFSSPDPECPLVRSTFDRSVS